MSTTTTPEQTTAESETVPQPLTFEQIATMQDIGELRIAPDGSRVIFVVQDASKLADKEHEHATATLWMARVDGGEPFAFTSGIWKDDAPRWSPDGTRIAFLSDRAERGKASLWVIPADGGEAQRVFDEQGSMSRPEWSPDGRYLAVLFTEPETDDEKKRKDEKDDAFVWNADHKFQRLWVIDPATREATAVSPLQRQVHGYAWSPDGAQLAACTTPTPNVNDIFLETELVVIPREGGEPQPVQRKVGIFDDICWSRDGARIAYRGHAGRVVHEDQVWVVPLAGGEPRRISEGYHGSVMQLTAPAGRDDLFVVGSEGVTFNAYWLSWDGEFQRIGEQSGGWTQRPISVTPDGSRRAAAWQSATSAQNVWVSDSGAPRRLTHFNQEVERAALGETEFVRWESDPGVEVEGILIKPFGYQEGIRYPLVVQIHGGPTWAWSDWFYVDWHDWGQLLAARGYAVLLPNPRGSTGRGVEYMDGNYGDIGGGELRDMLSGIDALIARGIADPEALGVGGWSWGGYMTAWTISQTTRFKAAVMGAGLPNMVSDNSLGDIPSANLSYFEQSAAHDPEPYWERSAIRYIRDATTPTLILHGAEDRRVHPGQGQELYVALRTLGVPTEFVTYPREGHGIGERKHQIDLLSRVVGWYDRWLKRGGAESDGDAS